MLTKKRQLTTLPIVHHDLWRLYKQSVACFWTAEEIDLAKDKQGFDALNVRQQHFLKHVLAFFAASDGLVNANLMEKFVTELVASETTAFYSMQMAMEAIHGEVYSRLIEAICPEELPTLLDAIDSMPAIKKKAEWTRGWSNSDKPLVHRMVAFACVEGIFFSGSFAAIFWLKSRHVAMPGLFLSNQFISRDEGLHTDFAVAVIKKLRENKEGGEIVDNDILDIVRQAVDLETEFLTSALPVGDLGMNAGLMAQYLRFVADRLLKELSLTPHYNAENPFPFMENISMEGKTNFFEQRVDNYQRAGVMNPCHSFTTDADF